MVAAHIKEEGCCIDGADVMYFMNVNMFKNKTKKQKTYTTFYPFLQQFFFTLI